MSTLMLKNVRLAFPQLFTAKSVDGKGEPAFSAAFLMAPTDPQIAMINAAIDAVAKEKWGAKAPDILKAMRAADKTCLHSGDIKADYDGYAGNMFINARNKARPLVLDANRAVLTEKDGRPYGGCYVYAQIELWAQDNDFGKRVNASLKGVQFYKDGDAFAGGAPSNPDDFGDLSAEGAEQATDPLAT